MKTKRKPQTFKIDDHDFVSVSGPAWYYGPVYYAQFGPFASTIVLLDIATVIRLHKWLGKYIEWYKERPHK